MTRTSRPATAGTILGMAVLVGGLVLVGQPARAEFFPNAPRQPQHQAPQQRQQQRQPERRAEPRRAEPQRRDDRRDDRRYEGRPYDRYNGGYGYGPPPVIYAQPVPPLFQFIIPGY